MPAAILFLLALNTNAQAGGVAERMNHVYDRAANMMFSEVDPLEKDFNGYRAPAVQQVSQRQQQYVYQNGAPVQVSSQQVTIVEDKEEDAASAPENIDRYGNSVDPVYYQQKMLAQQQAYTAQPVQVQVQQPLYQHNFQQAVQQPVQFQQPQQYIQYQPRSQASAQQYIDPSIYAPASNTDVYSSMMNLNEGFDSNSFGYDAAGNLLLK